MWNVNSGGAEYSGDAGQIGLKLKIELSSSSARSPKFTLRTFHIPRDTFRPFATARRKKGRRRRRRRRTTMTTETRRALFSFDGRRKSSTSPQRFIRCNPDESYSASSSSSPALLLRHVSSHFDQMTAAVMRDPFDGIFKSNGIPHKLTPSPSLSTYSAATLQQLTTSKVGARGQSAEMARQYPLLDTRAQGIRRALCPLSIRRDLLRTAGMKFDCDCARGATFTSPFLAMI